MLPANNALLTYIENLFQREPRREDIDLKKVAKGELLLRQGQPTTKLFIIKDGITKCFLSEENGKDYLMAFLGKGEIIGELEAIRNQSCLCNVEALMDVQAYALSISYFKTLLEKDLTLSNLLLHIFAERLNHTSSRASFQQLYTIEHSLSKLLALQANLRISISKEDMAAYLGITVRSLNRILGQKNE